MPSKQRYTELSDSNDGDEVPFLTQKAHLAKSQVRRAYLLLMLSTLCLGGSVLFFVASVRFMVVTSADCAMKLSTYCANAAPSGHIHANTFASSHAGSSRVL